MDVSAKPRCQSKDACSQGHTYCWVSHYHKYIYFETPKCGSTTLKLILPDKEMVSHLPSHVINDYFKFSFVRNPWDRVVSLYHSFFVADSPVSENRSELLIDLFGTDMMSFKQFVESLPKTENHHWEQCCAYFYGFELNFIGRFEQFSKDLTKIYDQIGLNHRSHPQINKTNHRHYKEYYDAHLAKIVANEFSRDIEMFGYDFDIT